MPAFPLAMISLWAFTNSSCTPKLSSQSSAIAKIIQGNLQNLGVALAQGHAHFSFWCDFLLHLGTPKQRTKLEVASFIYCRNIRKFREQIWDQPKGEPISFLEKLDWIRSPNISYSMYNFFITLCSCNKENGWFWWKGHFIIKNFEFLGLERRVKFFEPKC